jgi:hypothetical protein
VWSVDRRSYRPEIARTSFLKYRLCELQGDNVGATLPLKSAIELLEEIIGALEKPAGELEEADFDELVTFWSR